MRHLRWILAGFSLTALVLTTGCSSKGIANNPKTLVWDETRDAPQVIGGKGGRAGGAISKGGSPTSSSGAATAP